MSLVEESANWDGTDMADRIAKGDVTASEMVEAAIARAEKVNPQLNAVALDCFDYGRSIANDTAADSAAPFVGVPTVIKDNNDIEGFATRNGSKAEPGHPAPANSPFVEQLRDAGMIPFAKTTLPEYGLTATTESLLHGATRNPWNTDHSTGGSSGGSAALCAARVIPIAHANDGGGSIRIPASNCGLVGLKSTRGRLANMPKTDTLPVNIVCEGIVTRSVRDTARFFARAEQNRPTPHLPPVGSVTSASPMRLRIGMFTNNPDGDQANEDVRAQVQATAALLESLGHRVEEIPNPVSATLTNDFLTYWALIPVFLRWLGKRTIHPDYDPKEFTIWAKGLQGYFWRNFWKLPGIIKRMKAFGPEQDAAMGVYDLYLTPTLGSPPVEIGYLGPDIPFAEAMERLLPYASFTAAQNGSGQPGISLPLGVSPSGLPVGMHFIARAGMERMLLELAYELEQAAPWADRKPGVCA